ncbi:MAG: hypothetical protein RR435_03755 [Erysipelotrichaceae bacterium]
MRKIILLFVCLLCVSGCSSSNKKMVCSSIKGNDIPKSSNISTFEYKDEKVTKIHSELIYKGEEIQLSMIKAMFSEAFSDLDENELKLVEKDDELKYIIDVAMEDGNDDHLIKLFGIFDSNNDVATIKQELEAKEYVCE